MIGPKTFRRIAVLLVCVLLASCASAPERRKRKKKRKKSDLIELKEDGVRITDDDADDDRPRKKRKKKKRKKKTKKRVAEARREREDREREEREAAEREERRREREEREAAERAEREREEREAAEREKKEAARRRREAREAKREREKKEAAERAAKEKAEVFRDEDDDAEEEAAADVIDMTGDVAEEEAAPSSRRGRREKEIDMTGLDDDPLAIKPRVAAIPVHGVTDTDDDEPEVVLSPEQKKRMLSERPLTLAKSKLELHGGIRHSVLTLPDPMTGLATSSSAQGLALGATYGLSDKAEVGGDYTLSLSPGSLKGPFTLRGAYHVHRSGKLEIALAAALGVDFTEITDPAMMTTNTLTYASLQLGAWARYRVGPKLSLFTGLPALPASSVSLSKLALPLPLFSYQLSIGLNNAGTTALEVPIGAGIQATPNIYAFATLNVAHVRIANTPNAFLFTDFIPVALGAFYSLPKLDIGVVFADDLEQGTDYLRLETVARYTFE